MPSSYLVQQLLVAGAALCAGLLVALLAARTDFAFSRTPGAVVAGYLGRAEGNAFEQVGSAALNRFPALGGLVNSVGDEQRQAAGHRQQKADRVG